MNYFKIDLDWMVDLNVLETLMYGLILNSTKRCQRVKVDSEGVVYYQVSNNLINYWMPQLSSSKIRDVLASLEECGYITTYTVKRPNKRIRFVSCNQPLVYAVDICNEILNKYDIDVALGLGCMFKNNMLDLDMDLYDMLGDDELANHIYQKMEKRYGLIFINTISEGCYEIAPTEELIKLYKDFLNLFYKKVN